MVDSAAANGPATVWLNPVDDLHDRQAPAARSLGELVSRWISAYASGGWYRENNRWAADETHLPWTGLV